MFAVVCGALGIHVLTRRLRRINQRTVPTSITATTEPIHLVEHAS